jgi:putative ABC transport system ATP-binding protein
MRDEPIIKLENIQKTYQVGREYVPVLQDVNLTIWPGQFVAIVGASGNGKSTLLNMMTGIDQPTSGEVYVAGAALHTMGEDELARWRGRNLGIIFQFFQLLPSLNLLQNVILPMDMAGDLPRVQRRARAHQLLELVGLADQAGKLPGAVSGGQQQRAAIARALANDPPIIVADEPTGNLDAVTSDEVFDLFSQLVSQGKTVVVVTHDSSLAGRTPRVVEVANGQVMQEISAGLMPDLLVRQASLT